MVDQIRFFAGAARMLEGKAAGEYMAGHTSWVRREPIGVVGQVTPWNYPMMMAVWKIAPAIAAGNTVVLKPSDTTPVTTLRLAELAAEVLPPGVFNVVCGDRDTGRALVEHPVPAAGRRSPARCAPAWRWPARPPRRQAGAPRAGRQGAGRGVRRRRPGGGRRGHRRGRLLQRRAGLHRRHPGARRARASTTTSSPRSPSRRGTRPRPARAGRRGRPVPPVNNADQLARVTGFLDRLPDHAEVTDRRRAGRADGGFFSEPTVVAGLRQDDELVQRRGVRPGDHRAAVHRRGRGGALGQRRRATGWPQRLDPRLRPGDADEQAPRLRLRVDQHPHPAGRRDAARRLQALRLRQGPVALRASRTTPGSST